jgi:hypothetical protein
MYRINIYALIKEKYSVFGKSLVPAYIDTCGHNFQHVLYVHNNFLNTLYEQVWAEPKYCSVTNVCEHCKCRVIATLN